MNKAGQPSSATESGCLLQLHVCSNLMIGLWWRVVKRTQCLERGFSRGVLGADRVDAQRLGRRSSGCGPGAKEEESREKKEVT